MSDQKSRKTDRRTLYTRMVIKDALLSILAVKDYTDITIADICRKAEINRGTFYLHYDNIRQVLNELFDEALSNTHNMLTQIGCRETNDQKCTYPLCCFLRENKKYQPLFFSDALRSDVIDRIVENNKDSLMEDLGSRSDLSEDVLLAIFCFQLNGCLAISKNYVNTPDSEWEKIQCHVDRLLKGGIKELEKK